MQDKLLVLDVDQTICDYGFRKNNDLDFDVQNPAIPRPYLHTFLEAVYKHYHIALWSATPLNSIITKMNDLNISDNKKFKIDFVLDVNSMKSIRLNSGKTTMVKPLSIIWDKYKQYNATNTIMVDDRILNFHLNPENGLAICQYKQYMHAVDKDLIAIKKYLTKLAQNCNDFSTLNHADYLRYKPICNK